MRPTCNASESFECSNLSQLSQKPSGKLKMSPFPSYRTRQEVMCALQDYSDWPTYPQLYVQGDLVGGADIVLEMAAAGELAEVRPSPRNISSQPSSGGVACSRLPSFSFLGCTFVCMLGARRMLFFVSFCFPSGFLPLLFLMRGRASTDCSRDSRAAQRLTQPRERLGSRKCCVRVMRTVFPWFLLSEPVPVGHHNACC